MDSLFPFLQRLAPLQHVGLSRRTLNNRQFGHYHFWCNFRPSKLGIRTFP
jgi:hypothetical protein